jgi:hypothetical protein
MNDSKRDILTCLCLLTLGSPPLFLEGEVYLLNRVMTVPEVVAVVKSSRKPLTDYQRRLVEDGTKFLLAG